MDPIHVTPTLIDVYWNSEKPLFKLFHRNHSICEKQLILSDLSFDIEQYLFDISCIRFTITKYSIEDSILDINTPIYIYPNAVINIDDKSLEKIRVDVKFLFMPPINKLTSINDQKLVAKKKTFSRWYINLGLCIFIGCGLFNYCSMQCIL